MNLTDRPTSISESKQMDGLNKPYDLTSETKIKMVNIGLKQNVKYIIILFIFINILLLYIYLDFKIQYNEEVNIIDLATIIPLTNLILIIILLPIFLFEYFYIPTRIILINHNGIEIQTIKNKVIQIVPFSEIDSIDANRVKIKNHFIEIKLKSCGTNQKIIQLGKDYCLLPEFVDELKEKIDCYRTIYLKENS